MARFHYRLQAALDAAVGLNNNALTALHAARRVRAQHRTALDRVAKRRDALLASMCSLTRADRNVATFVDADACAAVLARMRFRLLAAFETAGSDVAKAVAAYAHEARRRAAFECHRSTLHERWQAAEALREESELDEANAFIQASHAYRGKVVA